MPPASGNSPVNREDRSGLIAGIAAFGTWGLIPVYWKLFTAIPAAEILAHRFVWTTGFLVGLLSWQQRWPEVREAARSRRALLYCFASGLAISVNWLVFIWAVNVGRVIETSLDALTWVVVSTIFQGLTSEFRYIRVTLSFTSDGNAVTDINSLHYVLSVKLKTDSGNALCAAADVGGTDVEFNSDFIDINSIVLTPRLNAAPLIAIYDFVDGPNPTGFKILLYDLNGNRVDGAVSWTVRGV